MNLSDIAILASIIIGLASVPFVASTISSDYGPVGNIVLGMNNTDIPGELSRIMTDEKFEQTYKTPFGKFTIILTSDSVYQELVRPDRKVIVEETPEFTKWELIARDYNLVVNKTGARITESFSSPDGYQEVVREMGNIKESVKGDVRDYSEAKALLEEELDRMEKIKQDYMELPGTEKVVGVAINEVLPDPEGSDSEGEFIEIYNYEDTEVNLTDWYIGDVSDDYVLNVSLDSEEFLVLWRNETGITLNNNGDEVRLYNDRGDLIDELIYGSSTEGESWARIPDGTGTIQEEDPTPGESND